jgi:putative (di)nucleoside polyphosphate hydrolase
VPLDVVIEFKRGVYQLALQELSRFIHRADHPGAQRKPARSVEASLEEAAATSLQSIQTSVSISIDITTSSSNEDGKDEAK